MFTLKKETSVKNEAQIDIPTGEAYHGLNLLLFIPPNEEQRQ